MKELLTHILEGILPDTEIKVEEEDNDGITTLKVHAPQDQIGKIIGKGGKTINAIKNIVKIRAIKENKRVEIDVVEAE